jgi:hypothetical protein
MIDGSELGIEGTLYRAGEIVPGGRYQRVDAPGREVLVEAPAAPLPASFDGQVALYVAVRSFETAATRR